MEHEDRIDARQDRLQAQRERAEDRADIAHEGAAIRAEERESRRGIGLDWTINLSHVLTVLGVIATGGVAIASMNHDIAINRQEALDRIELLSARVQALDGRGQVRTEERRDADIEIKQQIRDLRAELTEERKALAAHIIADEHRFNK